MNVAVIIPVDVETARGEGERDILLRHVRTELLTHIPEREVIIGICHGEWRKASAVADGLTRTDADVIVVHDADVLVPMAALRLAVTVVNNGAAWAIPHTNVHRLSRLSTAERIAGMSSVIPHRQQLVRWPYVGVAGGGIVVLRRETYEDCPLDERFIGWGNEDICWGFALSTLHGAPWRGDADLVHLYHEHAAPGATRSPRFDSERLRRAYRAYRGDAERMRALVDGAKNSVC